MKALTFDGPGTIELREVPDPALTCSTDVLIRVEATGICGTDLHIVGGSYPAVQGVILGHETTGVVLEAGAAVQRFRPGDRVILDPTYHCGACFYCQSDRPNYCEEKSRTETGVSRDGTFAEYHVADQAFLHPLPDELSFEEATLTEPLACCLHALRQARIRPDARALVVGAGPIGLLFAIALDAMGVETTLGEVQPYRLAQARCLASRLARRVCDLGGDGLDACGQGRRFDLIVDTSGRMLEALLPRIERGGDLVLAGLDYTYAASIRPSYLTDNGIRLIGSIDTNRTFAAAISMLRRVPALRQIVTHRLSLDEYADAFALLGLRLGERGRGESQANKVVLVPVHRPTSIRDSARAA
jgi:2-desacetyl-2-hydroxyethyl bacteriochlorophyllide A dehydrogenase